jgi:hypothetical protein
MLNGLSERSPAEELIELHRVRASKEDFAYERFRAKLLHAQPRRALPGINWSAVIWSIAGSAVAAFICAVLIL